MAKRNLKIYVHHSAFVELPTDLEQNRTRGQVTKAVVFSYRTIFGICYLVGQALIWPAYKLKPRRLQTENKGPIVVSENYFERIAVKRYSFGLKIFILLIIISLSGFQALNLLGSGFKLKGQVLGTVSNGLTNLKEAQDLLAQQKGDLAEQKFADAMDSFQAGQAQLNDTNIAMQGILQILPQKRGADKLLEAAGSISAAGVSLTKFYQDALNFKVTANGISNIAGSGPDFGRLDKELAAAVSKIDGAQTNLNEVDPNIIPQGQRSSYLSAKDKFNKLAAALHSFSDTFKLIASLLSGDKQVLLVFENNNELRPTGGFMGTYGIAHINNGQVKSIKISSIYDLDGQLKDYITPPSPIFAVNNRWYLRDSNWFTSFPQSAKKIVGFYEKEGGQTPDLVIALTPNLIVDLLKITGPIEMPRYNATLTADNFVETTQIITSVMYDKTLNQPKQMLADFFPVLLQHLSDLKSENAFGTFQALEKNLEEKQILFYSNDSNTEKQLSSFNWTGELKDTDRDYLAISGGNYGGTKTDLYIDQKVNLDTNINSRDQSIVNTLTITRSNKLPSLEASKNISFIRVYVPLGSTLLDTKGFEKKNLNVGTQGPDFRTDADIQTWEDSAKVFKDSGTLVGQESGKTIIANWLELSGGETKTITIRYKLPFSLASLDKYSLLLQKQPGTRPSDFSYKVNFSGLDLLWKNFDAANSTLNSVETTNSLNKDYLLGMVFKDR